MSHLIFLRHGHSSANAAGLLTGRLPGVALSKDGTTQAKQLVERIGPGKIDYLHASPMQRCQETIDPWLRSKYSSSLKSFEIREGIIEIDFGKWSGRKLSSLRREKDWKIVQNNPSQFTFPDGESFKKAQRRAVETIEEILAIKGENTHLIVSHSDIIKLILAHFLKMKLDAFQSLQISPASFTHVSEHRGTFTLNSINSNQSLKELLK